MTASFDARRGLWVKTYRDGRDVSAEAAVWGEAHALGLAPRLLAWDDTTIISEHAGPPLGAQRGRVLRAQLIELLVRLGAAGIAHRDVSPWNVCISDRGPVLIDWESSCRSRSVVSYDLFGPAVSGVPVPNLGLKPGGDEVWWDSPMGMGRFFGSLVSPIL